MKQENDDHEAYDDRLLDQIVLERLDRRPDQSGPVVAGDDFDPCRKALFQFLDLAPHAVDDVQRVLTVAHHHDAAHCFALAVPLSYALPNVRTESHGSKVAN